MTNAPLKVIVTRRLPEPVETRMRELFDVELNETDEKMDAVALAAAISSADILVPTLGDTIDQKCWHKPVIICALSRTTGQDLTTLMCKLRCDAESWSPTLRVC